MALVLISRSVRRPKLGRVAAEHAPQAWSCVALQRASKADLETAVSVLIGLRAIIYCSRQMGFASGYASPSLLEIDGVTGPPINYCQLAGRNRLRWFSRFSEAARPESGTGPGSDAFWRTASWRVGETSAGLTETSVRP